MNSPIEAVIFREPLTNQFGFRVRFVDRDRPHFMMDTCVSLTAALDALDPQRERVWETPAVEDPNVLLVSRAYKDGSVMALMEEGNARARG